MGTRQHSSHHHHHHHATNETPEERKDERKKRSKKHAKKDDATCTSTDTPTTTTAVTSSSSQPSKQQQQSLYYSKKLQLSVSILPCGLRNVEQSAKESIRPLLLKYCNPMGGILLAYDNVQVVNAKQNGISAGIILNELPHVHYNITCNALVFCPTVGLRLEGTVVEASFHSHLVLVVHDHFNASISAQHLRACGFDYDNNYSSNKGGGGCGCGGWYHVASCQYLGAAHEKNSNQEEDNQEEETSSQIISRIQFTLEKLHEVGGITSMDGSDPSLLL